MSRRAEAGRRREGGRRGGQARSGTFHGIALRVIEIVEVREVLVGERLHRELLHGGTLDQKVVVLWPAAQPADPLGYPPRPPRVLAAENARRALHGFYQLATPAASVRSLRCVYCAVGEEDSALARLSPAFTKSLQKFICLLEHTVDFEGFIG